jgi:transposase
MMNGKQLRSFWRHRFGSGVGKLRKVNHQVKVVKDGRRFFVTNALLLSSREVKAIYRVRQLIEETFRLLKQEFGWGASSAQKQQGVWAHLHLGLYALCLTQLAAKEKRKTIYEFKRELFRETIPTQTQFLQQFKFTA